jgi:hypothetical protein
LDGNTGVYLDWSKAGFSSVECKNNPFLSNTESPEQFEIYIGLFSMAGIKWIL